jgi:membrane protease YdiL (CAAX protease family)
VVVFYAPVIAGSLLYLFMRGQQPLVWHRTFGDEPMRDVALGVLGGLLLLGSALLGERTPPGQRAIAVLGRMFGGSTWSGIVAVTLSSAVGEELLFRAVLQPVTGLAAAAVLFAVVHFPPERDLWPWPIFALGAGAVLGALFHYTGAILAPVIAHALLNGVQLWRLRRAG